MSLFDAPKSIHGIPGTLLVHACNTEGFWGAGIAKEFKKRFPESFLLYKEFCEAGIKTGEFEVSSEENGYNVGCLFTSSIDSRSPDSPDEIIVNTVLAVDDLLNWTDKEFIIYSNKFNSGLFNVPWDRTEAVLKVLTKKYDVNWTVCDPDLDTRVDGVIVE